MAERPAKKMITFITGNIHKLNEFNAILGEELPFAVCDRLYAISQLPFADCPRRHSRL